MTKIAAMTALYNGDCDLIAHGVTEFVMIDGEIKNKRSKKTINGDKLGEDGWETKSEPKWYDFDDDMPILCFRGNEPIVALGLSEENGYVVVSGTDEVCPISDLEPASRDEALTFVYKSGAAKKKAPSTKPKAAETKSNETSTPDEPKEDQHSEDETAKTEPERSEPIMNDDNVVLDVEKAPVEEEAVDCEADEMGAYEMGIDLAVETSVSPKPEAGQTKSEKSTAQPKAATIDASAVTRAAVDGVSSTIAAAREEYQKLGVKKEQWHAFWQYFKEEGVDVAEELALGKGNATTLILAYNKHRAQIDNAVDDAPKRQAQATKAPVKELEHRTDEATIDQLEFLTEFGLEEEDILPFYAFRKMDKYAADEMTSNATDEELTQAIQEFYEGR
jgi:glucan-binding YG repeat protein